MLIKPIKQCFVDKCFVHKCLFDQTCFVEKWEREFLRNTYRYRSIGVRLTQQLETQFKLEKEPAIQLNLLATR